MIKLIGRVVLLLVIHVHGRQALADESHQEADMPGFFCVFLIFFSFLFQPCYPAQLPQGAYLSAKEWRLCEQFIQTEASAFFSKGITYIPCGPTHPCSIEQDASTGSIYIHLKGKKFCNHYVSWTKRWVETRG